MPLREEVPWRFKRKHLAVAYSRLVTYSAIAAVALNRTIGKDGRIPWMIPGEQALFKRHTMGKAVAMGRVTWDSIPEEFRPLPGRLNIVITSRPEELEGAGCLTASSVTEAISLVWESEQYDELVFAGGERVYKDALPWCSRLYLTTVDHIEPGDKFFPKLDKRDWWVVEEEYFPMVDKASMKRIRPVAYTFQILSRTRG